MLVHCSTAGLLARCCEPSKCLAVANHRFQRQHLHSLLLQLLTPQVSKAVVVGGLLEFPAAGEAASIAGQAATTAGEVVTVAGGVGTVAPVVDPAVVDPAVVHFGSKHLTSVVPLGQWFHWLVGSATLGAGPPAGAGTSWNH